MSSEGVISSVQHEGFTVESTGTADEIKENLRPEGPSEEEKPDISKAASDLGKRGGEAAAKAKAKAAREAKKEAKADGSKGARGEPAGGSGDEASADEVGDAEADADREADDEAAQSEADKRRGNPRHDPTARVAEATRQAKEARQRAERVEREAADLRYRLEQAERERQRPAQPPEQAQPAPDPDAEPQEGDYESYAEYVKAVARHEYNKAAREDRQQAQVHYQAMQHVQRVTQTADAFKAALTKAAEADPEIRTKLTPEVMNLGPSFMLEPGQRPGAHNWIADELISAPDKAPALMLHLSENPQEFQRIAALSSPRAITRELAILSVRLDAATSGPSSERRVSKASPPPTPVGGSPAIAGASNQGPKPGESFDQWLRRTGGK